MRFISSLYTGALSAETDPPGCLIKVPDEMDGWEDNFEVPKHFSTSTMFALRNGQLNASATREIVQAVTSKIMNICRYPTTGQTDCGCFQNCEYLYMYLLSTRLFQHYYYYY